MMKYVYLGISITCIVIMTFCGYYFLGGYDTVDVLEVGQTKFSIVGKPYQGKFNQSDSLRSIQDEISRLIRNEAFKGDFAEVNYVNTGISEEEVELFLGVLFYDQEILVPQGYMVREFSADKLLAVKLTMHPLVMPTPEEVEAKIYAYAKEKSMDLQDQFIAVTFNEDDSMEIYAMVK